jgi:hypothetical protein
MPWWAWALVSIGGIIVFLVILGKIGPTIAYNIGKAARVISPPKPPRVTPMTPEVKRLRRQFERAKKKLARAKQIGDELKQMKRNE